MKALDLGKPTFVEVVCEQVEGGIAIYIDAGVNNTPQLQATHRPIQ